VLTFPASLTTHLAAIYYGAGSTLAGCLNFGVHLNQSEDEIAAELVRRVRKVGMEPTVGIAASRELATLAARCGGIRIIPAGGERDFSDWLPLDLLGFEALPLRIATAPCFSPLAQWHPLRPQRRYTAPRLPHNMLAVAATIALVRSGLAMTVQIITYSQTVKPTPPKFQPPLIAL